MIQAKDTASDGPVLFDTESAGRKACLNLQLQATGGSVTEGTLILSAVGATRMVTPVIDLALWVWSSI